MRCDLRTVKHTLQTTYPFCRSVRSVQNTLYRPYTPVVDPFDPYGSTHGLYGPLRCGCIGQPSATLIRVEGGSQAQDHGRAIYAKIQYSVSSTFATGCCFNKDILHEAICKDEFSGNNVVTTQNIFGTLL